LSGAHSFATVTLVSNLSLSRVPGVRVGTFNIRHGETRAGAVDLRQLVAACRRLDVDLLALQEVDRWMRRTRRADLAGRVGRRTGMARAFAPALRQGWVGRYGNAVLARGAIGDVEAVALPSTTEARGAVVVSAWVGERPISVAATHLSVKLEERDDQLDAVLAVLARRPLPHLLLGDLNGPTEDVGERCARAGLRLATAGPTFPAKSPTKQIDHIAYAGLELVGAEVVDTGMSDHCAVVAEFA
jgi:endonuclease/exonuclease/phosphatase family metal-dependent hydrolase